MTAVPGRGQGERSARILNCNLVFRPTDASLFTFLGQTFDKQGLIQARRKATICGTMLSVVQQYLWDTAELLEGCASDNVDVTD